MEAEQQAEKSKTDQSMKLAIAVAILRSKLHQKKNHHQQQPHEPDALKWKHKAKERKQEIIKLHEDLKLAEDGLQHDLFPQSASCKCYFYDHLGNLSPKEFGYGSDGRFNDVLRRRFLRQVRINQRRRRRASGSSQLQHTSEYNSESEKELLCASVDFLVELCETVSSSNLEQGNFKNWSHQAVDFILTSLKNFLPADKNEESVEGIVSSLITRLLRRMCTASEGDVPSHLETDTEFYVQHVVRKLGSEPYIGQRIVLSVSQRISMVAERLLFMDPFDDAFPSMHSCMYMMIQLIEFLVSDYLAPWSTSEGFDTRLFEEWVASVLHTRKAVELLENRNALYVLFMDRVIGTVAKQVSQFSCLQDLNPDIVANLFS